MAKSTKITDEMVRDISEMIGYGITYWAVEADWENSDIAKVPAARSQIVCAFREAESEIDFFLTAADIRKAIRSLYDGTALDYDGTPFRGYARGYIIMAYQDADENGIDCGHIDSDAADVIAQIASIGKVVYG